MFSLSPFPLCAMLEGTHDDRVAGDNTRCSHNRDISLIMSLRFVRQLRNNTAQSLVLSVKLGVRLLAAVAARVPSLKLHIPCISAPLAQKEAIMALEAKKTLIMRIYQVLDEYSDEEHPLTQQNIIDILERDYDVVCERKAVGRNISYLKEMGFDIESCSNGTYLASRKFENAELRLLIDSVLSSRNVNSTHSAQLIDKLISFGGQNFKSHVKHVYSVKEWDKSDNKAFFYNIDVVDEAIEQGKKIKFNYNKIGLDKKLHVSKPHVGSPYQMLLHNQRYYLMMFDEMFDEVGFYRMDKITDIDILDEDAKPLRENKGFEKGIDYKRIATSLPYMYNDAPVAITLKCWVGMADTLYDWFGTNFTAKKLDDKYFVATIVASEKAMLYWVLQYNRNVEVLSPESLRQNVIASLKKSLALYQKD